ncbi:hypothetical protein CGH73_25640, partial [Vibrio parahaemolyticus]
MLNASIHKITKKGFFTVFFLFMLSIVWLFVAKAQAATLSNIQVSNSPSQAEVTLSFTDGKPDYSYFP